MIGTITCDRKAAAQAESTPRITETGAYVGTIMQSEQFETKGGATMARLYFVLPDQRYAWLTLCLVSTKGETPFTYNLFQGILANMGVQSVTALAAKCRAMNGEIVQGTRMPEMEKHQIGLVLEAEPREYQASDGSLKITNDMTIRMSFDPATRKTCAETDGNMEAKRVDAQVKYLTEHPKPVKRFAAAADGFESPQRNAPQAQAAQAQNDVDDCPF